MKWGGGEGGGVEASQKGIEFPPPPPTTIVRVDTLIRRRSRAGVVQHSGL